MASAVDAATQHSNSTPSLRKNGRLNEGWQGVKIAGIFTRREIIT